MLLGDSTIGRRTVAPRGRGCGADDAELKGEVLVLNDRGTRQRRNPPYLPGLPDGQEEKCGITSVPMSSIVCMTDSCEIL